uniref:Uncharacterized protein n=1 Tax=Ditylenchus dipsaci TaxID=166011 RepID=A0A915DQI6_9BILA
MDWKSVSSRIRVNSKRVFPTAFNDKRMRASAIAFILCSTSLALFQNFDVLFNTFVHLFGLFVVCNLVGGYRQYKYTCQAVILALFVAQVFPLD